MRHIYSKTNSMNKNVVYTVITNGYDDLIEPDVIDSEIDYICFTDSDSLKSENWKIRKLPEWTANLPENKKQRMMKVLPHVILPEYEKSLYIDGNIKIVGSVMNLINILDIYHIMVPTHPSRECVYREAVAVMLAKKDIPKYIMPQVQRYLDEKFPVNYGLFETNIIFRKHNEEDCKRLMDKWALEIMMGSHRDQISFTYAMWVTGVDVFGLPKTSSKSSVFSTNMLHTKKNIKQETKVYDVEHKQSVKSKRKRRKKTRGNFKR